jgi:hypothetical protein
VVDGAAGDHEARVQSAASDASQRMPCPVVKPVPELVEPVGNKVFGGPEVEPRVDWMRY